MTGMMHVGMRFGQQLAYVQTRTQADRQPRAEWQPVKLSYSL